MKACRVTNRTVEVKWTRKRSENTPSEGLGREEDSVPGPTGEVCDGGRGPDRVQYAVKDNNKRI